MPNHRFAPRLAALAAGTLAILALVGGCGGKKVTNSGIGTTNSTSFKGTVSGSGVSGTLWLTVQSTTLAPQSSVFGASASAAMNGTLLTGSGAVSLSGTYDTSAHHFTATGGGWSFMGGPSAFGLDGTFAGPSSASGAFAVQTVGSGTDTVVVVIGTFISYADPTPGPGGVFNFAIRGGAIQGNAWENGSTTPIPLVGTFTPAAGGGGTVRIDNPSSPGTPLATGVIAPNGHASGSYDTGAGDVGLWDGQQQ